MPYHRGITKDLFIFFNIKAVTIKDTDVLNILQQVKMALYKSNEKGNMCTDYQQIIWYIHGTLHENRPFFLPMKMYKFLNRVENVQMVYSIRVCKI